MITYSIALATLNTPGDVCYIVEKHKTKFYNYTFQTHEDILNYGKACDNEWMSGTWGNRIYRKAGGIPGWHQMLADTSASKMTEMMEKYLPDVHKNDVIITVNDWTQDLMDEDEHEIERFLLNEENKLVQSYIALNGCMPVLNIQSTRSHPNVMIMFNNLFEEVSV